MSLEQIYAQIWACLASSAREESPPIPAIQAATIGLDGAPSVRTVALRHVSEPDNLITFHTDLRSPKVAELEREPRIALLGLDAPRNRQIRVAGTAHILRDGPQRLEAWKASIDRSLTVYRTRLAPGTPMAAPSEAFGEGRDSPDEAAGFRHFCVVVVRPDCLEWLEHSEPDRHERARFVRDAQDNQETRRWRQSWIAP